MNDISPIGHPHAPQSVSNKSSTPKPGGNVDLSRNQQNSDSVQLSNLAQWLSKAARLPEVREDLVASVRADIADESYLTDDKIDAAIDSLVDDLI